MVVAVEKKTVVTIFPFDLFYFNKRYFFCFLIVKNQLLTPRNSERNDWCLIYIVFIGELVNQSKYHSPDRRTHIELFIDCWSICF